VKGVDDPDGGGQDVILDIGGTRIRGTLDDTAAARDFADLLPLTVRLRDFHQTEKIGDLPRRLATGDAPPGVEPVAGGIAYYAPWGNLALFYQGFRYSEGLVRLGRVDADAIAVLAGLADDTAVSIQAAG
jgi:hypothetical protein